MSSSSTHLPTPEGPGSVSGAPNLPAGFTDTFTSRYIDTGELRQHAVIPGVGHWVAEQAPEEMVAALTEFLAPYRESGGGLR
jgi:pimeloyl-ACP methyl ester carboxylesterase